MDIHKEKAAPQSQRCEAAPITLKQTKPYFV